MTSRSWRRRNGRWERGTVGNGRSPITETEQDYLKRAGAVLDAEPTLLVRLAASRSGVPSDG